MKKETKKLNRLITKVEGRIDQLTKKIEKIELKFESPTDAILLEATRLPGCYKSAKTDYLRIKYRTAMEEKSMLQDLLKSLIKIANGDLRPDPIEDTYEPRIIKISDEVELIPVEASLKKKCLECGGQGGFDFGVPTACKRCEGTGYINADE